MRRIVTSSALLAGLLATHAMAAAPSEVDISRALHQRMVTEVRQYVAAVLARAEFAEQRGTPAQVQFADDPSTSIPVQIKNGQVFIQGGKLVPRPTEKAAYLGVATGAMTGALRHQLNLPKGTGLVVMYVDKDSPAGAAGIQQDDVIEKLDDQILVNGPQFQVLVRDKKPDDSVTLTVIRGGQRLTLTAKLAEKELPVLDDAEQPAFMPAPQAWNGPFAPPIDGGDGWQHGVRKTITDSNDGTITRTLNDGQNEITLTTTPDGQSNVVIRDKTGKQLFSGPYTRDEDKKNVPAEFAGKIQDLQTSAARVTLHSDDGHAITADSATITRTDADQSITLTITGNRKSVVAKDAKTGETLYDGPASSNDDFSKMPAGVAEKVKAMMAKVHVGN